MIYYQLIRGTLDRHASIEDFPEEFKADVQEIAQRYNEALQTDDYRVIWRDTKTNGKGYVK